MGMKLLENIRQATGLKDYGIHQEIVKRGCNITYAGLVGYNKPTAQSIRLDVQKSLKELCIDYGISKSKFEKWQDEDAEAVRKSLNGGK